MEQFVEVAVNQTLRGTSLSRMATPDIFAPSEVATFHYRIPPHLRGKLAVGQMVWVPFGPRTVQGVILNFSEDSPVPDTKDVKGILKTEPEVVVIGRGSVGNLRVLPETKERLEEAGIEVLAFKTAKACGTYRELRGQRKVAAILHITC